VQSSGIRNGRHPIKALVVDADQQAPQVLDNALRELDVVLDVDVRNTLPGAAEALASREINVVYIDLIGLGIDGSGDFIFKNRKQHPEIVFVLYYDTESLKAQKNNFYAGKRQRFHHYFTLEKSSPGAEFTRRVRDTLSACQGDLSYILTQEKISGLQNELKGIQESASDDNAVISTKILRDIQEQLSELKKERHSTGPPHTSATFLGTTASSVTANRCFIIMPYSQPWSEAVETILRQVCTACGFEFAIAKEMDGRFIPHDIWKGITGSAIMIADLTGANANVAYEIGLADAIGREVILLCQETSVPFDFLAQRLIVYENTVHGSLQLQRKLKDTLETIKQSINGS